MLKCSRLLVILLMGLVMSSQLALAGDLISSDAKAELEAQKNAIELIDLSGFRQIYRKILVNQAMLVIRFHLEKMTVAQRKALPPDLNEKLKNIMEQVAQKMESDVVAVVAEAYQELFTPKELKQMVTYQKSPVARKAVKLQPALSRKIQKGFERIWKTKGQGMVDRAMDELRSQKAK